MFHTRHARLAPHVESMLRASPARVWYTLDKLASAHVRRDLATKGVADMHATFCHVHIFSCTCCTARLLTAAVMRDLHACLARGVPSLLTMSSAARGAAVLPPSPPNAWRATALTVERVAELKTAAADARRARHARRARRGVPSQ